MSTIPPHKELVEEALIASIILSNNPLEVFRRLPLKSEHFFTVFGGAAFAVLETAAKDNENLDYIAFCGRMLDKGIKHSQVAEIIGNIQATDPTYDRSDKFDLYITQLAEECAKRKIQQTYQTLAHAPQEFIDMVKKIEIDFVKTEVEGVNQIFEKYKTDYDKNKNLIEGRGTVGVVTGFSWIDEKAPFTDGNTTVLAAAPGVGKTALALNMAINASMFGFHVLFFTAEMSKNEVMERLYAYITSVSSTKFKYYNADSSLGIIEREIAQIANKLKIIDSRISSDDVLRTTINVNKKEKVDLVVVDYIQFLADKREKGETDDMRIGRIMKNITDTAKECGCAMLALSQFSREGVRAEPQLHHLRGSGNIEQDASTVLFLQRDPEDVVATLTIAKNRHGQAGISAKLKFMPSITKYTEQP